MALTNCRLTVDGCVDAGSLESIVRGVVGALPAGADDEQKVLALFRYVFDHVFLFPGGPGDLYEDFNKALKILNWWGYGLCGTQAKVLGMLAARLLGHDNVRLLGIGEKRPGCWRWNERPAKAFVWSPPARDYSPEGLQGHSTLEVRWGGAWHFLDVTAGFYRRNESGAIAGLDELLERPELVDVPAGDWYGDMPYGPEPEIFTQSKVGFREVHYNSWPGRLAPLDLRPGESFTFLARPIPGAYYLHPLVRQRYGSAVLAPGPRGHWPDRPVPTHGNGLHVYQVELRPEPGDPHWCPESADWHVPVELPYPIMSIRWRTDQGCSGFLRHRPTTGDRLLPVGADGFHYLGENASPGCSYRLIVRSPDRNRPARLELKSVVQLNPLVLPGLKAGDNVVRLSAGGSAERLAARLVFLAGGEEQRVELSGAGEHRVTVPAPGPVTDLSFTLLDAGQR